ncbi:MAG: type IV pilus modification protein PilV [Burkholderiales bacterium]|jgi:type IV pilus assembly protein PilV|uniref:type IV pilus modification protein PilV n=1 Tax=Limnobacter sp. TaxID=2003368 RepID=UPI003925CD7C|nr:type IV pilus modification protein PilV [Burkholderiales bacterium]
MRFQKGLSLIEVLVAMFIFSLGILGLSSTQLVGLKASAGTNTRNQAEFLASDILERIRANRANASSYQIALSEPATTSPQTVAQHDLNQWKQRINSTLTDGKGSIQLQGTRVTINITWSSRGEQRKSQVESENLTVSSEL